MATYTPNYGLHQWVPEDNFQRTDFNTDLSKIDTVLGQKAEASVVNALQTAVGDKSEVVFGSCIGEVPIVLGFQAKAVIVATYGGTNKGQPEYGFAQIALADVPSEHLTITETGFVPAGNLVGWTTKPANFIAFR